MLIIENFGSYCTEIQERLLKSFIGDNQKYVSYYTHPSIREIDDEELEMLFEDLIHFYDLRIKDVIEASIAHHIFMHCYNKNISDPMDILADAERTTVLIKNGKLKLIDHDLKENIKKAVSKCLWLNTDYNEYERLKQSAFEINKRYFSNCEFHACDSEVIWYEYACVSKLVSDLYKNGRFEFLLIEDSIESFILGFEIYENTESFDLRIYPNETHEQIYDRIRDLGFEVNIE